MEWLDVLSGALSDQTPETLDIVGYANTVVIRYHMTASAAAM